MVVTKAFNAIFLREFCLSDPGFRQPEVVKTQVARNVWLVMAGKERFCFRHVRPFGETLSPPFVVFRNRMELRQIECDQACVRVRFSVHGSVISLPTERLLLRSSAGFTGTSEWDEAR